MRSKPDVSDLGLRMCWVAANAMAFNAAAPITAVPSLVVLPLVMRIEAKFAASSVGIEHSCLGGRPVTLGGNGAGGARGARGGNTTQNIQLEPNDI